jgi:hypothetical protein
MSISEALGFPVFENEPTVEVSAAWGAALSELEKRIDKDKRANRKLWKGFSSESLYAHQGIGDALTSDKLSVTAFAAAIAALFNETVSPRLDPTVQLQFLFRVRMKLKRGLDPSSYQSKIEFVNQRIAETTKSG